MNKHILVLSVVAVFALATGIWLQYKEGVAPAQKDLLFAALLDNAAQIEQIEITNSSGDVFNARQKKGQWLAKMSDVGDTYPVQQNKLSELLRAFSTARLVEAKTAKPTNYRYLGLQGLDTPDSLASLVKFTSPKESWQVLVGNQVNIGKGNYVRLPKEKQSWLIDQNIVLPTDQHSWLKQPILPFELSALAKISRIDKQQWSIEKSSQDAEYYLAAISPMRLLKYDSILSAYVSNITNLNFEELHHRQNDFWDTLETQLKLEIVTVEGMVFNLTLAKGNDKTYAKFGAENQQAYWLDWVYQISSFSAQQLRKNKEDFLREESDAVAEKEIVPLERESISGVSDEGESPQ